MNGTQSTISFYAQGDKDPEELEKICGWHRFHIDKLEAVRWRCALMYIAYLGRCFAANSYGRQRGY
jgi:hypothetical protein